MTNGDAVRVRDRRGDLAVVAVSGPMDYDTERTLREGMLGLLDQNTRNVVLDLTDMDFFDSTGIRVLFWLWRRVQNADGTLALAAAPERVRGTLKYLGIDEVIPLHVTVEAATEALQGGDQQDR